MRPPRANVRISTPSATWRARHWRAHRAKARCRRRGTRGTGKSAALEAPVVGLAELGDGSGGLGTQPVAGHPHRRIHAPGVEGGECRAILRLGFVGAAVGVAVSFCCSAMPTGSCGAGGGAMAGARAGSGSAVARRLATACCASAPTAKTRLTSQARRPANANATYTSPTKGLRTLAERLQCRHSRQVLRDCAGAKVLDDCCAIATSFVRHVGIHRQFRWICSARRSAFSRRQARGDAPGSGAVLAL